MVTKKEIAQHKKMGSQRRKWEGRLFEKDCVTKKGGSVEWREERKSFIHPRGGPLEATEKRGNHNNLSKRGLHTRQTRQMYHEGEKLKS